VIPGRCPGLCYFAPLGLVLGSEKINTMHGICSILFGTHAYPEAETILSESAFGGGGFDTLRDW